MSKRAVSTATNMARLTKDTFAKQRDALKLTGYEAKPGASHNQRRKLAALRGLSRMKP